ncbi:MAG: glycosyltransferase [Lachnospiraceae bacterium]|nr:glycosyltransferase [Lachnospiraceae bacterium]
MNICLLNDSFPPVIDGVANVVMNYAGIMTKQLNANVIVGTPKYPGADYEGYPYTVVPYPSFDTTEFVSGYRTGYPLSIREIAKMTDFAPDIIHTHCPAISTMMARILRKETGTPIVFTYHTKFDVDIERAVGNGFRKKEIIRTMVNNISACDEVWVVSRGSGENLRSLGYEGEYRVMDNGVDFPRGKVSEDFVRTVTENFDVPEGIPLFLFVGRIMKYKGLPIIIDALRTLSEKGIDFRMVFVGGGADAEEMQDKIREYGITLDVYDGPQLINHYEGQTGHAGKIIFTGPEHDREKLRAWNTRADLFLFPSVYDTNGIVVREAAACGLASVLIKDSCAAEGITDGRNGYLIDENPEAMAALLEKLCPNLQALHTAGQYAMDEIYISWEDAVRNAYDRYEILHEMAKNNEFGHRKHQSVENLINSMATILNGTQKVFIDIPRDIYGGMRENMTELKENVTDNLSGLKENVTDNLSGLKENVTENLSGLKENVTDNLSGLKENVTDNLAELKDNIAEKSPWNRKK